MSAVPRLRLITVAPRVAASSIARTSVTMSVASVRQKTLIAKISAPGAFSRIAGDGGAVAEPIDVVVEQRAVLTNREPARHAAHVRMRRVHAAVDHGDADSFTGAFS